MRTLVGSAVLLALTAMIAVAAAEDKDKKKEEPKEIVINISGKGADAKYLKDGDMEQKDVTVNVGQTVKWVNKSGDTHSATALMKVAEKPLFDTGEFDQGNMSIKFDEQKYKDAGGKDGKPVTLGYFCTVHGKAHMSSNLILKPADK